MFLGSIWAVWFHFLSGLRHLYYDSGRGFDIPTTNKTGWGIVLGSIGLTLITITIL